MIILLEQPPKFSIGRRIEDKSVHKRSPGPIYDPSYNYTHYVAPKFSMTPRREVITLQMTTPAPNQYDPTVIKNTPFFFVTKYTGFSFH